MAARQSLLIVDDSEAERRLMALTLCAAFPEADVLSAAHPALAKEMCATQAFDCVLMDYNMPDMDGLMLAHQLRAEHRYMATVLMTSFGDEMLAAEALRSGISDYIPKSRITQESLQRMVGRSIHTCSQARLIDEQREELENFAYALAHDFKQPIRQIITFSEIISQTVGPSGNAEMRRHLRFLIDAASRLGRLVDVMSQYTLLNQPPALSNIDLNRVVDSVRTSLGPFLAERQGEFVAIGCAHIVRGNETLMTQVLQNLVINGLRYNKSRTPRVELSVRRKDGQWIIDVADNGVGIDAGYLTEIFKPLVRLHNASEYPGSGLGLTLARKAMLAQRGAIWCESTPGGGSVFHVQAPAARASRKADARSSQNTARKTPAIAQISAG
jgi:signal transduction histidine kinase